MKMRKQIILLLAALLSGLSAMAGERTLSVVKQLTFEQKDQLPDKTLSMKLPELVIDRRVPRQERFVAMLDTVADSDCSNQYFLVHVSASGSVVVVEIESFDPFDVVGQTFDGIINYGYLHFIVAKDSAQLLPVIKKGKIKLERVFEMVEEVLPVEPSHFSFPAAAQ